jgi:hypothetical protein
MDAEQPQKSEQNPRNRIIDATCPESEIRLPIHRGNKKQINQPAYAEKSECEKIDSSGDRLAEVKAVGAGKSK